jgi:hypothetical protein
MWIEWRKFTNGRWRFKYAMLFGTFCLMSLLTIALPNFVAIEGLAGQTKQQVEEKPRADQTSSLNLKRRQSATARLIIRASTWI